MSQATLDDVLRAHPGPLRIDGNGEAHGACLCCGDGTDRWWAAERDGTLIVQCRRPECVATFEQHLEALGLRDAGPAGFGKHIEPKYGTGKGNVDWPSANEQPPAPPVPVSGPVTTPIPWMNLETRQQVIQTKKDPPPASWHGKYKWPAGTVPANLVCIDGNRASTDVVFHEGGFAAMAAAVRMPQFMHVGLPNAGTVPAVELLVEIVKNRHVAIWPDHDVPGRKHGIKVASFVRAAGSTRVRWIDPPKLGLTEKGHDAADWIPNNDAPQEFKDALIDVPEDIVDPVVSDDEVRWRRMSDIVPRPVPWIWPKRIAAGEITLVNGDPGSGKSLFAATLAAGVTRGTFFPDGTGSVPLGGADVLWIGHAGEDALDYTVAPRFEVAGADLDRVTAYDTDDDKALAAVCASAALRRPLLAVIDSWAAWAADTGDNNSPESVRERFKALRPLQAAGVGVLLITHSRKMAPEGNQLDTVSGSRQVTAIPRMALEVRQGGVYQTKHNLSSKGRDLAFEVEPAVAHTGGRDMEAPRLIWLSSAPVALQSVDSGPTVDDVVDMLTGPGAPTQPTRNRLYEAFEIKAVQGRMRLDRVLSTGVADGRLKVVNEKVAHVDRDVYRPST